MASAGNQPRGLSASTARRRGAVGPERDDNIEKTSSAQMRGSISGYRWGPRVAVPSVINGMVSRSDHVTTKQRRLGRHCRQPQQLRDTNSDRASFTKLKMRIG